MSKLTLQQIADSLKPDLVGVAVDKDGALCGFENSPVIVDGDHYFCNEGRCCYLTGLDFNYQGNWEESWTPRTKQHKKLPMSHLWGMAVTWGNMNSVRTVTGYRDSNSYIEITNYQNNSVSKCDPEGLLFTKDPTLPFSEWKSYEMLEEEYNK